MTVTARHNVCHNEEPAPTEPKWRERYAGSRRHKFRSKPSVCPHCGHPTGNEVTDVLSRSERELFQAISASGTHGIIKRDLMKKLYEDDPSGGPENPAVINVMVYHINQKIRGFGLRISARPMPHGRYRVFPHET